MLSVLVMIGGNSPAALDSADQITRKLLSEKPAVGKEIEILVAILSGVLNAGEAVILPEVRLLDCFGLNAAEARNLALQQANGEIICFIDADCVPAKGWLAALIAPFKNGDVVGVRGVCLDTNEHLVARFWQLENEECYRRLRGLSSIEFVDMYSAAYRRQVLLANGGFDERFRRLEEQELSYRLTRRGYKLVLSEDAQVNRLRPLHIAEYTRTKAITGFWKAQVIRLFPDRSLNDSYTPPSLKVQVAALAVAVLTLLLTAFWPWTLIFFLSALSFFFVTTLPFIAMIWSRDRAVCIIALPMLAIRAVALASGYALGVLCPPPELASTYGQVAGANYFLKRIVDVIGSVLGLAVTILLAPVIFAAIKLDSPGPVFFRQRRVGRGGEPFTLYKFRTMERDAEQSLDDLMDVRDLEQPAYKLINDPRVTTAGRLLRRWSLDELPQFWNVLRGDMSLVGPRPEEERIVALYSDWHRQRLSVKPGMTGPMQVHGRGNLALDERVRLEIEYIEKYTLWRDINILLTTIPSVLKGEGAR